MSLGKIAKKIWHFVWEDNSPLSWAVNIVLAFVLIKFVIYPGLGLILGTSYPIVAVVSGSMEHRITMESGKWVLCDKIFPEQKPVDYDTYWSSCGKWYEENKQITKEEFLEFPMSSGFNKGDIIILKGAALDEIKAGDIIVFRSRRPDPIIHRVVDKRLRNGEFRLETKGDHNKEQISEAELNEKNIGPESIIGKSFIKVPLLGYIKIWFVEIMRNIGASA